MKKFWDFCEDIYALAKIIYGYYVYRKISKDNAVGSKMILNYDYSGLGDIFVFSLFLSENEVFCNDYILTVRGNSEKKIVDLFGLKNVIVLKNRESKALANLGRIGGDEFKIRNITPFSYHFYTDVIQNQLAGMKFNMLDIYKYQMFELGESAIIRYPDNESKAQEAFCKKIFTEKGLKVGRTVILSPFANTIKEYPKSFWRELAVNLQELGFSVATNCGPNEIEIQGTIRLSPKFDEVEGFMDCAGYFVGLRSGFCDLICNSRAKKIIIYPQCEIFNSDIYMFCSFERMNIGQKIKEIKWNYTDYDKLKSEVIKKIGENTWN